MSQKTPPVLWHRLIGTLFSELLTPVNITVQTEVPLLSKPPLADLLLIRREGRQWTAAQKALLPDGIWQNNARETLVEVKVTESVNEDVVQKAAGYDVLYRQNQGLGPNELATVVISAMRPRASMLTRLGYQQSEAPGVYHSALPIMRRVGIISLNELSHEAHNAFAQCFASQKKIKEQAFQTLELTGYGLVGVTVMTFLVGLRQYWFTGDTEMSAELTAEKVMALGEKWIQLMLQTLSPEERLAGLRPEDVLVHFRPEERLMGLQPEEIEAYLQKLKKQEKLGPGGRQVEA
ncbi:MAG: hypothetical protein KA314_16410 [Chloroflexi bacterium]|nr:hypothetical protein [Chloroflexota bacterium]MBP8057416.1 hypothetical protein [Chloroflexota bacterium]